MLLALDPASLTVVQWSVNAPVVLGLSVEGLQQCHLSELVDANSLELIERLVDQGVPAVIVPLQTVFCGRAEADMHLGAAHLFDGVLILEFEVRPCAACCCTLPSTARTSRSRAPFS